MRVFPSAFLTCCVTAALVMVLLGVGATTLPEPPNFPAPAAPDYDPAKPVATREAYGFALKRLGAVNSHVVAISGDVKIPTSPRSFRTPIPTTSIRGISRNRTSSALEWDLQHEEKFRFWTRLPASLPAPTTR